MYMLSFPSTNCCIDCVYPKKNFCFLCHRLIGHDDMDLFLGSRFCLIDLCVLIGFYFEKPVGYEGTFALEVNVRRHFLLTARNSKVLAEDGGPEFIIGQSAVVYAFL